MSSGIEVEWNVHSMILFSPHSDPSYSCSNLSIKQRLIRQTGM